MGNTFQDFIAAAREGGKELEVVERAGSGEEVAAGARELGYEFSVEEVDQYASRKLTDEEMSRVAGGFADRPPVNYPIAIFP